MKKISIFYLFLFFINFILFADNDSMHVFVVPDYLKGKIEDINRILAGDSIFTSQYKINRNILKASNLVDLDPSISIISGDDFNFNNIQLMFHSSITATDTIIFEGDCSIMGHGSKLFLDENAEMIVAADSTLRLKHLNLAGISGSKIRCYDDTANIIFDNCGIYLNNNYNFSKGSLIFEGDVSLYGSYAFTYDSNCTSTINRYSKFYIKDATINIGRYELNNIIYDPIFFTDNTSVIGLDNSSLITNTFGLQLTRGVAVFDEDVLLDINSTDSTNGLIIGDGSTEGNFQIKLEPVAKLRFNKGHWTYNNTRSDYIKSESKFVSFIRGSEDYLIVNKDLIFSNCILDWDPAAFTNIYGDGNINFNEAKFSIINNEADVTGLRYDWNTLILNGNDNLNMEKGSLTINVLSSGLNNYLLGNGILLGNLELLNDSSELIFNFEGTVSGDVVFNGGSLKLESDLHMGQSSDFLGSGSINLQDNAIYFPSTDSILTSSINWLSNNGLIHLKSNLGIEGKQLFTGDCIVNGDGCTLDLSNGGEILIEDGVSLKFKNIRLKGVSNKNIRCLGNNSKIMLDNVLWSQSDDYVFDMGSLKILNEVDLFGSSTFYYESAQTSTIDMQSKLELNGGLTFITGRSSEGGNEPIYFEDSSSILKLNDTTFCISEFGMRATRGTLVVGRDATVDIVSSDTTKGLILGDGTADNDIIIDFEPGGVAYFKRGALVYNNYSQSRILSRAKTAKLLRGANSIFYLNSDVLLSGLFIDFSPLSSLLGPGMLSYKQCSISIPTCKFEITGNRYNNYTSALTGDDYLFLSKGNLPMYILVSGTGNSVYGEAVLSGQIILEDANSELSYAINGLMSNVITLSGGTLILDNDLVFDSRGGILGFGNVNLKGYKMTLGVNDINWSSSINFISDNGTIDMHSNITLTSTCTFDGNCTIYGHGNTLEIGDGGTIYITDGSTLKFKDLQIKDVNGNVISLLGDTSRLAFENVQMILSDDFNFNSGCMDISQDCSIQGPYNFIFTSDQKLIINPSSKLQLDNRLTFSYDPISTATDLIEFKDNTSILSLNNASIVVSGEGLSLTRGFLNIKNNSFLYYYNFNESAPGISFGTGMTDDDIIINIKTGSFLHLSQGIFNYNNVDLSSLNMEGFDSVLGLDSGVIFKVNKSIALDPGIIRMSENASIFEAEGQYIDGAIISYDSE